MFDRNETAANTKTRPRGLAKQIWGGEAGLAEAIRKEEAWENENGTISWYEEDQKHIRGSSTDWKLTSSKKLSATEKEKVDALLESMGMGCNKSSTAKLDYEKTKGAVPPACFTQLAKDTQL